jgi:thiol-disulfide isomerase/thioredoxin
MVRSVNGQRSTVNGTILLTAVLLLGLGAFRPVAAQFEAGIPVGTRAPAVTIHDVDGKPMDFGAVLGRKPVLIEFWATWCSLCKALLPQLEAIQKTWGDRVELLGVNVTVNDSRVRVKRYLKEHRPPFRALYDEKGVGARAYDVPGTSYVVVVDRQGKVSYTGSGDKQDLVAAVARAFQVP